MSRPRAAIFAAALLLAPAACSTRTSQGPQWSGAREEPPPVEVRRARVGELAPDFALEDLEGATHRLSDLAGRIVVLEWIDPGCAFVEHSHARGVLATLPAELAEQGVVWLGVNSSGRGRPGSALETNRRFAREYALSFPILLDPDGQVGRAFGATLAPQIIVIDAEGVFAYSGPVDNAPFGKVKGGGSPTVYVREVAVALIAGRPIEPRRTRLYGCTIRYALP